MNRNLASTVITDKVRVSTAVIESVHQFGKYYQYETIVFAKDEPAVEFSMEVHGTSSWNDIAKLTEIAIAYHNTKVDELTKLLIPQTAQL